jgi:hypothetical protein
MYLHLHDGPEPLDTALNPLAPGARPYSYRAGYPALGQGPAEIRLPDDLFAPNATGYVEALKTLGNLYSKFKAGTKKSPSDMEKPGSMGAIDPATIGLVIQGVTAAVQALSVVARGAQATAANNRIQELYSQNQYNVQNLNRMNRRQLATEIDRIDAAINMTPRLQFGRQMALARFRLIYQQRYDQLAGVGGALSALPGWVLPVGLGLLALTFLRR